MANYHNTGKHGFSDAYKAAALEDIQALLRYGAEMTIPEMANTLNHDYGLPSRTRLRNLIREIAETETAAGRMLSASRPAGHGLAFTTKYSLK